MVVHDVAVHVLLANVDSLGEDGRQLPCCVLLHTQLLAIGLAPRPWETMPTRRVASRVGPRASLGKHGFGTRESAMYLKCVGRRATREDSACAPTTGMVW